MRDNDLFDFSTEQNSWNFLLSAPSLEGMNFETFQNQYSHALQNASNNQTKIKFWVDVSSLKDNVSFQLMFKFAYMIAQTRIWSQEVMERVVVLTGGKAGMIQNFIQVIETIVPLSSPMVVCETRETAEKVFAQPASPLKKVQFMY